MGATHETRPGDRYSVRRSGVRACVATVTEIAIGYVWVVFNGDLYATPYAPSVWSAMVVDGRAMYVGSVVPDARA